MENFEEIFQEIKSKAIALFESELTDYKGDLKKDTEAFLEKSKTNMQNWGEQLAQGKTSEDEIKFVAKAELSLGEMFGYQQAGKTAIRIDKLQNNLIKIVVDSLTKLKL